MFSLWFSVASAQDTAWWDPLWTGRAQVKLDNTSRAEDLDDFPVLVTLTEGQTFEHALAESGGEDLRFVDEDGTELSYEIEQWNVDDVSLLWVRVPRIEANSTDHVWMYWGAPGVAAGEDAAGTWSSAYTAVWHLDGGDDATSPEEDASENESQEGDGRVGRGRELDGDSDQLVISSEQPFDYTGGFTVSAWMRTDGFDHDWTTLIGKGDTSWRLHRCGGSSGVAFSVNFTQGGSADLCDYLSVVDDQWHYVVGVYNPGANYIALYVDGLQRLNWGESRTPATTDWAVWIGNNAERTDRSFDGQLDEARAQSVPRSATWIDAEYDSIAGAFVSWCSPWVDDDDGDGVCNSDDLCPEAIDGDNLDGDALPDSCDPCPLLADEVDGDDDGFWACEDCDDGDDEIHPDAVEIPGDEIDNDCVGGDEPPEEGDTDTDSDSDADSDADTDSDSDADTDSDADSDPSPPRELSEIELSDTVGCGCAQQTRPSAGLGLLVVMTYARGRRRSRIPL